jgi:hypothetical protein
MKQEMYVILYTLSIYISTFIIVTLGFFDLLIRPIGMAYILHILSWILGIMTLVTIDGIRDRKNENKIC